MKRQKRVVRRTRTAGGRKRKGFVSSFLETVSGIVLIPIVIYAATNINNIPLPARGDTGMQDVAAENVAVPTEHVSEKAEDVIPTEEAEAAPKVKEEAPSIEEAKADEEKEVAVNGSTSWHKYMRTEPQREVQAVIKKIAKAHDVDWKMAYAICLKESRCNVHLDCSAQYGRCDNGQSFGPWQIYRPQERGITVLQAEDFEWATNWSIARLKRHGSLGTYEQIRSHNGLYEDNRNTGYVEDVQKLMSIL